MPISKFGFSLEKSETRAAVDYYKWNNFVRSYIHDNTLCLIDGDFDANLRRIKHIAEPLTNDDAVNKQYVEGRLQSLKAQLDNFEEKLIILTQLTSAQLADTQEKFKNNEKSPTINNDIGSNI